MSRHDVFCQWQGPRPVITVGETQLRLPVFYHHNDVFTSVHAASYDAVAAELPSEVIRPARWADGRALVAVTAFRYHAITWAASDGSTSTLAPYGEVRSRRWSPPGRGGGCCRCCPGSCGGLCCTCR